MWEKVKDKLFEEVLPEFPNLTYRSAFNRALGNLSMDQRKLLQEKLLQIEIDFRRACNSNLPQNERELLQENLLQIAENLEVGIVFANLSPDEHNLLAQKLWEIAVDLENEKAIPESIDVEGGLTIVCGGIEDDKLVLRRYTNQ